MLVLFDQSARNLCDKKAAVAKTTADFLVSVLLDYLSRQQPAQLPSIDRLAASANVSPGYLRHIVKHKTGVSFGRYVKLLRLRHARQLLQETFWSVKQVMLEVGLSDHSHFAKDYKKEFGESPTQTRWHAIAAGQKTLSWQPHNSHSGHTQTLAPFRRNGKLGVAVD